MNSIRGTLFSAMMVGLLVLTGLLAMCTGVEVKAQAKKDVSFKSEVFPLIKKNCLPCHAEDNYNPSGLVLDNYGTLMEGGEHGAPVEPGKGSESLFVRKLLEDPPFGDVMPLDMKKKKGERSKKRLTQEEIRLITEWIDQGARDN